MSDLYGGTEFAPEKGEPLLSGWRDVSYKKLAQAAELSTRKIRLILSGEDSAVTLAEIRALAILLRMSAGNLVERIDYARGLTRLDFDIEEKARLRMEKQS